MNPARGHPPELAEFPRFYREHLGYVRHVVAHLGVPHAVDDVVQETFVTAYRRFSSLRPEASSRAWLAGIARRTAYRWRRTFLRGRRRSHALRVLAPPAAADPGRVLDASRFLDRFLDSLDRDKRDVFVLAEVAQLRAPEIAEVLGLNPNTVYTRLRASRKLLATAAEAEGLASPHAALSCAEAVPVPTAGQVRAGWLLLLPRLGSAKPLTAGLGAAVTWIGRPALRWAATLTFAAFLGTGAAGYHDADETRDPGGLRSSAAAADRAGEIARTEPAPPVDAADPRLAQAASNDDASHASRPNRHASPPSTQEPEIAPDAAPSQSAPGSSPRRSDRRGASAARHPPKPNLASIAAETALLERAVAELSRRPGRALALARRHAQRFPGSQLSEARAAIEVRALCRLGQSEQARARATRFAHRHRGSTIARTVAQACEPSSGS